MSCPAAISCSTTWPPIGAFTGISNEGCERIRESGFVTPSTFNAASAEARSPPAWTSADSACSSDMPEKLGVPLEGDRDLGELCGWHQGCQVPFRPPIPKVGLLLRRCSGKGLHLAMAGEPRGFSRVAAGFSSYDGEFRLPLVLAQASPIFHSSCEGKLGIALE